MARNDKISEGKAGFSERDWLIPKLRVGRAGTTPIEQWDFYTGYGFGLFSPRAIEVLKPYFGDRFQQLSAQLEGYDYLCLRCCMRNDCLDQDESRIEDGKVMSFDVLAFRDTLPVDPAIFSIPEDRFGLYCTVSVPKLVKKAGLRGFAFKAAGKE